jgi:hypothetical protein
MDIAEHHNNALDHHNIKPLEHHDLDLVEHENYYVLHAGEP